jgi:hypothetical protein
MNNQPPLYTGKGKKPAALVRSTAKSKALRAKNTDPLGLLRQAKKK